MTGMHLLPNNSQPPKCRRKTHQWCYHAAMILNFSSSVPHIVAVLFHIL